MDAFGVLNEVLGDYENFVKGFLEIKYDQFRCKVEKEIADGLLSPGARVSSARKRPLSSVIRSATRSLSTAISGDIACLQ